MESAAEHFLQEFPLVPAAQDSKRYEALVSYMDRYITSVNARCMIGAEALNHPELVDKFLEFNSAVDQAMGLGMMLPTFLRFLTKIPISRSYKQFRKILLPIIQRRRQDPEAGQNGYTNLMSFILGVIDDDERAADLVTISVWIGLRNLQITVLSTLLDIINVPNLASQVTKSLAGATVADLSTFGPDATKKSAWSMLRSSMFESIRLCGPITGPARIVSSRRPVLLASDPSVHLPPNQVATLSPYYSHRQAWAYGADAAAFKADRFVAGDPDVGSTKFITWGLKGPHTCPGRWFAQEAICVMVKALLLKYEFEPERVIADEEKYIYHAGVVTREEAPVVVKKRR